LTLLPDSTLRQLLDEVPTVLTAGLCCVAMASNYIAINLPRYNLKVTDSGFELSLSAVSSTESVHCCTVCGLIAHSVIGEIRNEQYILINRFREFFDKRRLTTQ
jgi:hypothetical protein